MNRQTLFCVVLICLGFSLVNAAAQTQAAAGPPAAAPTTPVSSAKAAATPLPDPQTPQEFFERARQLSDLEASGIPFHLKATYVASGDAEFTGNGTYEEWWRSKDAWRKEATVGDYKYVEIQNGGKQTAAATAAYIPLRVREVMGLQLFHIASPKENMGGWKLSQGIEGSGAQEIATREQPCDAMYKSFVCTHQYEFTERGWLKSYRINDLSESYTNFQPFGNLYFPRKVAVTLRGDALLIADIVSLENLSGTDHGVMDTRIPADLPAVPLQLFEDTPAKDVTPPKAVHVARLKYPKSERKRHPNSLVIVACTIDATGAVREPYVQLSGGTAFDRGAMDAVRKYKFSPAMKNGVPGMADLNLVINFRFF
jgi:TonB family protein